ncbi:MAG: formylglycine-generating enzyme family protein [Roseomonas sp.]|nr:formylglycine-generating enzyme family protein [Roseomonas sp.]
MAGMAGLRRNTQFNLKCLPKTHASNTNIIGIYMTKAMTLRIILNPAAFLLVLAVLCGQVRDAQAQSPPSSPQARNASMPTGIGFPVRLGDSFRDCSDCPELVVIPPGRFLMGSPATEKGRYSNEGPQRDVVLRAPLAVGKFEVTFAEWDACVAAGGCSHRPNDRGWGRGFQPVIDVSWEDTQQYILWLKQRTAKQYRLLTEAEWEYAARAGTTSAFVTGHAISEAHANHNYLANRPRPTGSYAPNRFGLHDMHGNVWEWVQDCLERNYVNAPGDASEPVVTQGCAWRATRGGSWSNASSFLRSAMRYGIPATNRRDDTGFRVARW